jgi:hypothetical protein
MMMIKSIPAAALLAALAVQPAIAKDLRGDAFITALKGNTLIGQAPDGKPVNLYFLPGGQTSYQEAGRQALFGTWNLDQNGDVCVKWAQGVAVESGCFRVSMEGTKVTWSNKNGTHVGGLLGTVQPTID